MNGARGEVELVVEGERYRLCLTLGALAQIETAFGCASFAELQARMRTLSATEIGKLLGALLRGGGEPEDAIRKACERAGPGAAARAVAEAFHAALG